MKQMQNSKSNNASSQRILSLVVAAAIILSVVELISFISTRSLKKVQNLTFDSVTDKSVVLKWEPVEKADGYRIYRKTDSKGSDFELVKELKSDGGETVTIEKLEQATPYIFTVKAFKQNRSSVSEGKSGKNISVFTKPEKVLFDGISYVNEGQAKVNWIVNEKADGYELEYSKTAGFEKPETEKLDKDASFAVIKKLDSESPYNFRIRSYIKKHSETVYSEWSDVVNKRSYIAEKTAPYADPSKPMIALTFDDGPSYNEASEKILDVLEKNNAHATFFMIGTNVNSHTENVKRKVKLGCELGNHTYDHSHYGSNVTASDIKRGSEAIYNACGQYPTCFRSPGGKTTSGILNECKNENMALYYWSVDTKDWKSRNADKIYQHVIDNAKDGDIVLMHEIYESTADAVERMVPELIKKGFQLVTVSELIEAKSGEAPIAGQQYTNATTIKNETN